MKTFKAAAMSLFLFFVNTFIPLNHLGFYCLQFGITKNAAGVSISTENFKKSYTNLCSRLEKHQYKLYLVLFSFNGADMIYNQQKRMQEAICQHKAQPLERLFDIAVILGVGIIDIINVDYKPLKDSSKPLFTLRVLG